MTRSSRLLRGTLRTFCAQHGIVLTGKTVLCALSGGRDSVVLLHLLREESAASGFCVVAAHYNHHLRETAQRDEDFVRTLCTGLPLVVGGGDVAAFARATGTSHEEAGRILRYRFLDETAREMGADFIATAHHAQDNAETVLLHLLRGTGLQGICGIPPVRLWHGRTIFRPLLDVSRTDIDTYLNENALPYVEDESNADPAYTRNRIRHELLPLLEELSPGSTGRIAAAATRLRYDSEELAEQAAALLPPAAPTGETVLPAALFEGVSDALALRLIRLAAQRLGVELTAAQTEAVRHLKTGGVFDLPHRVRALRSRDALCLFRRLPPPPPQVLHEGVQTWGAYRVSVQRTTGHVTAGDATLLLRADALPLTITCWDGTGRLTVGNGRRTVKRLLADHGVPLSRRDTLPALWAGDTLAAVLGAGTDQACLPCGNDQLVITLEYRG